MTVDSRIRELEGSGPLRYGAHVYRATDQSINSGTVTPISWSTAIEDNFGFWSEASAATRLRVPIGGAGLYLANVGVVWDLSNSTTTPQVNIHVYDVDTTTIVSARSVRGDTATANVAASILNETWLLKLNELEEIAVWVFHATGVARPVEGFTDGNTPDSPYVKLYRLTR